MDRYEFRRQDYSLSSEQQELRDVLRDFLSDRCETEVVRAAEPTGTDAALWAGLQELGLVSMALPERWGGDEAALTDLVIVAEQLGRRAAPVPWAETVVAARTLARALEDPGADDAASARLADVLDGGILGIALDAQASATPLVAAGAVATGAIVLQDDRLELWEVDASPELVPNTGASPVARWSDPARRTVIAAGPRAVELHRLARVEWWLLASAALTGMSDGALEDAAQFVTTRMTRGVSIGTLQAISHPLADAAVAVASGRNLTARAAWMQEHEPGARPDLAPAAFAFASRSAERTTTTAVHVQGGLGFSDESVASLYFLRARTLGLIAGDPADAVMAVATAQAGFGSPAHRSREGIGAR